MYVYIYIYIYPALSLSLSIYIYIYTYRPLGRHPSRRPEGHGRADDLRQDHLQGDSERGLSLSFSLYIYI